MKTVTAAAAAISIALAASPALAGVVITQQQTQSSAQGERKLDQTVMVQGNKEKVVSSNNEIIVDLDKGMMYVVDLPGKVYLEIPYPPHGMLAGAMQHGSGLNFKKVGKSRNIAGYSCEEYTGTGKTMFGEFTVTECVAKSAPGASEFSRFAKLEMAKLKGTAAAPTGDIPNGIPLSSVRVTRSAAPNISGLTAEQQKRIQEAMANRKPTTVSTLVSKIEEKKLADDTFEIPAGFTKREMQMKMGMPMAAPHPMPPVKK
jgi:hypothetical protein